MKKSISILALAVLSLSAQQLEGPRILNSPSLLASTPLTIPFAANSAGTTARLLVVGIASGGTTQVKTAAVSDVGVIGIAMSTATSGSVQIATRGETVCTFENAAVANEIVVVGTSTAGNCRSSGQTASTSISNIIQIIGRVIDDGAAGDHVIQIFGPGHYGTSVGVATGGTGQTTYTKGDLLGSPGGAVLNKVPVGSNGQVVTADSASANGFKWAAPSGGTSRVPICLTGPQSIVNGDGTVFSCSVPANTLGAGGCIEATFNITSTAVSGSPLLNFKFGAATAVAFKPQPAGSHNLNGKFILCNTVGVTNAQVAFTEGAFADFNQSTGTATASGFGANWFSTFAEDTTTTLSLLITVSGTAGGNQVTPEFFVVR